MPRGAGNIAKRQATIINTAVRLLIINMMPHDRNHSSGIRQRTLEKDTERHYATAPM